MKKSRFIFKKQKGGRGRYAGVILSAMITGKEGILELSKVEEECRGWNDALQSGCEYFYQHLSDYAGLKVHIEGLNWLQVDTNEESVKYVVVKALEEVLNVTLTNSPYFDEATWKFVFPAAPSL